MTQCSVGRTLAHPAFRSCSTFRTWLLLWLVPALLWIVPTAAAARQVAVMPVKGVINPIQADYIDRGIGVAEKRHDVAVIMQLDTPGGLDTSMREIVQRIIAAKVPVVVYVSPQGARAASAGMFITMAAHVASMAPNTAIGAAHPVAMGGGNSELKGDMAKKVVNDAVAYIREVAGQRHRNIQWAEKAVRQSVSASATEALKLKIVDVVADSVPTLLAQIDGRTVKMSVGRVKLRTRGAAVDTIRMNFIERFLFTISDPNIAYILLSLGMLALLAEFSHPGAMLPGIVGVICLLLAFFSLGMLPVNYAGLFLILFAFILFVAEFFVTSHGVLTVGAVIALTIGSLILINSREPYLVISKSLIFVVVGTVSSFFLLLLALVLKTFGRQIVTGQEGLIGRVGRAKTVLSPGGMVLVEGELWQAQAADTPIQPGEPVQVERLEGLKLIVKKPTNQTGDQS